MAGLPVYRLKVTFAWWWPLYAYGLSFACGLMCREPDWTKVEAMARRATRVHVVREDDIDDGVADGE